MLSSYDSWLCLFIYLFFFFFFNDTATTEIYSLSLHDALPISRTSRRWSCRRARAPAACRGRGSFFRGRRSEEHTSELQSRGHLVCRLLLEKKKKRQMDKRHDRIYAQGRRQIHETHVQLNDRVE